MLFIMKLQLAPSRLNLLCNTFAFYLFLILSWVARRIQWLMGFQIHIADIQIAMFQNASSVVFIVFLGEVVYWAPEAHSSSLISRKSQFTLNLEYSCLFVQLIETHESIARDSTRIAFFQRRLKSALNEQQTMSLEKDNEGSNLITI